MRSLSGLVAQNRVLYDSHRPPPSCDRERELFETGSKGRPCGLGHRPNRIDEIVVFGPLTREQLERIVGMLVSEVDERMREHGLKMSLTSEAAAWLASNGFNPMFGARPLRRAVQRFVESPLSKRLLAGDFTAGDRV